ncbi:hypothetical protein JR316_0008451 [Psilocybe cubensis]|uniref:C2H2-type domain-containing protein n=2 Tax=Psilocybe cubensis TaxID=181762 RepID=A0A8H7XWP0_PSICU|nr:hypothetical protein JR316_0008451 [Psilocybe cubensis]KAH9479856.1 hypothetical protein JR316_0008451 [Psilocybe cubensis]
MLDILPQSAPAFFQPHDDNKISSGNLYLCQPHTVIQLVEVAPPPPRRISSVINSSSAASSSYSSSSSSFDDEDMDEDEDEEEICSSYCSSDLSPEELEQSSCSAALSSLPSTDSRMKRILLWRQFSDSESSSSLKRKVEEIDEMLVDNSDNESHTSKRSRSHGSSASSHSISSAELNMHPCPACDAFFPTLQSLRQHGQRDAPHTSEACCVAVEYAFEQ